MIHDLEHLQDHINLIATVLRARLKGRDEADVSSGLAEIQARISSRLASPLASTFLVEQLGLVHSEMMVVWTLAALEVSADVRALFEQATGDSVLSLRALRSVVYGESASAAALHELSDRGVLRRSGLLETRDTTGQGPWSLSRLALDLLHGQLPRPSAIEVTRSEELAVAPHVISEIRRTLVLDGSIMVAMGLPGSGRRTVLTSVAHELGREPLQLDLQELSKESGERCRQLRAACLDCRLTGRLPLLINIDLVDDGAKVDIGRELIAELDSPVLATSGVTRPVIRWDRPAVFVEIPQPSTKQLGELWHRQLGEGTTERAEALATRYPLAPALIHHAAKAAKARVAGNELSDDDITAGIRAVLDDRLGQFARRVTVTQTWDDIVLPLDQLEAISELISRVRGRRKVIEDWGFGAKVGKGLGVSALFSGPPGTGKTMLASLIAQDLGLELYQVDLGKVVSKWIGETEKNLGALFDAAEAGHAILLFDEADALFGKRTDVKSSNDRHANLETNYLLQRLESYTGVCLLTTNHDSHIDPAFQRRLSLHLRIELPEVGERAELWRAMLPPAAPVADDLDFEGLARRYAMSGGYIRNAVLRAAFVAADRGKPITHEALERAARREYEGMGKIVFANG